MNDSDETVAAPRSAPAALRNRDPILDVLRPALPLSGRVLEIASGTGEHALHFARNLPALDWQTSDPSAEARDTIEAWRAAAALPNLPPPLAIDVMRPGWDKAVGSVQAILAINMIHISPWAATLGLLAGAGRLLPDGGLLYLYGPYRRAGHDFAPSNAAFDADLRARDPAWGIRDLATVVAAGADAGLRLEAVAEMPANNLSVFLRRVALAAA